MTYKQKEVIGDAELWLGDCIEVMEMFRQEGRTFDACITDPPYGIQRDGQAETFTKNPKHKRKHHESHGWDDDRPSRKAFDLVFSLSSSQIIWGGNYFVDYLPKPSMGWLYWDKGQDGLSMSDGELAYTSEQKALRAIKANRGKIAQDGAVHPTQKPVFVIERCINYLPTPQTILDPFMGSGTTGVACMNLGRKFIGIEIEPKYFEVACQRIENAQKQGRLFE